MGIELAERRAALLHGTINAGGTLTNEIDFGGWNVAGLISSNTMTNGTISFQVSAYPDADSRANYVDLTNGDKSALGFGATGTQMAISGDEIIAALQPYKYVKVKTSIAQANGVAFFLPVKA